MYRLLLIFGFWLALATPAMAQKRVALIIGNGNYTKVSPLPNPARDAAAVEAMLKTAGFGTVLRLTDLTAPAMRRALRDFSDQARGADVAVVFYAGHGIEVNGTNYLIPVDAVLERDIDVEDEAVPLERVTQILDQTKRLRLIILDACRDNPFVRTMKRTITGRSIGRGLAQVDVLTSDTLIAFAAKAGSTAADGDGTNSPYTTALVRHLVTPGLDVRLAFGRIRDDVVKTTSRRQEPFVYGSLGGAEIALVPAAPAIPNPQLPPPSTTSAAAREWQDVKDTTSLSVLERYVQRHTSDPVYAALAQDKIDVLKRQQQAALATAEAERQRREAEQREKAVADAAKKKAEEEARRRDPVAALVPGSGQSARDRLADGSECLFCPEMVVAPAGNFVMGSPDNEVGRDNDEGPLRRIAIARPFAIGKFEVAFAEWDACVAEAACTHKPDDAKWGRGQRPVMGVSWDDITKQYLPWLSRKTGKSYRLLSEAEWEYAARAGTATRFSFGNDDARLGEHGWFNGNSDSRTQAVGQKKANPWGLYDMHGNVWEWTEDCWHANYQGAPTDGSAWVTACTEDHRSVRGGSWNDDPRSLRSANRFRVLPGLRYNSIGFRVARTP